MGVSENGGTPKSSILIGFSIINHPFWGTPIFGNTHICNIISLPSNSLIPASEWKHFWKAASTSLGSWPWRIPARCPNCKNSFIVASCVVILSYTFKVYGTAKKHKNWKCKLGNFARKMWTHHGISWILPSHWRSTLGHPQKPDVEHTWPSLDSICLEWYEAAL